MFCCAVSQGNRPWSWKTMARSGPGAVTGSPSWNLLEQRRIDQPVEPGRLFGEAQLERPLAHGRESLLERIVGELDVLQRILQHARRELLSAQGEQRVAELAGVFLRILLE